MDFSKLELIKTEVFLDGDSNEVNPKNIYINKDNVFIVEDINGGETRIFKLIKSFKEIEQNHKGDILEYCLGSRHLNEELYMGDVFLHGGYIKEINLFDNDFVLVDNDNELVESLDTIYSKESIDELKATGFKYEYGEQFISMKFLSDEIRVQYKLNLIN